MFEAMGIIGIGTIVLTLLLVLLDKNNRRYWHE